MLDISPDEQISERDWSLLGLLLSLDAWETFNINELVDESVETGATRTEALRKLAGQLVAQAEPSDPAKVASHAKLIVAALIKDAQRYVVDLYCAEDHPEILDDSLAWVGRHLGEPAVETPLLSFTSLYPPASVRKGTTDPAAHLQRVDGGRPNRDRAVRELVVLYLAIVNRAMRPLLPLFDDAALRAKAQYTDLVRALEAYFERQPPLRGVATLFRLLRAPLEASPDDLEGQLAYILEHWADLLPEWLQNKLLRGRDVLREETALRGIGPGSIELPVYRDDEYEAFTPDRDWMANVVLIAKQTHVWLDQLSRTYGRAIRRLDQIPDEELDRLAAWGFTGLWLIGVWERSVASSEIKRRMGNPEAMASAYSLYDYVIAEELGGPASYDDLARRAGRRGIRLAADMVPNHVGIYSKWVVEHPDWFIQLTYPPFPGYRFTGPNLSWHPDVEIRIEDGYWNHTDAAVVFERRDARTGDVRYIYHGNDGTQMPWNDTAQLDYLNPEVREAVVQTIMHVARQFPVIRFDAAMTLAKRHYRRLWFPAPGEGGAIPSRAEHGGLTREQFDKAIPNEFWREVVDRVGAELPDTLLLAEAFWLMEGYFVRTLGMHRVYNSAFMNMLRMEDNSRYRQTLKDVLKFSPEVLKRFVNFMNNPDERTAVEQFGKGDKYFGICTMMATLPGLPMFGHGQIEGFAEKYGMEYPRAYWDEQVDEELVRRHEREIFPLVRRRHLFSHADAFVFYDFFVGDGSVNENVFAYSNAGGGERALVIYNNAYESTAGWVRTSTPKNVGRGGASEVVQPDLAAALQLDRKPSTLCAFRDHNTGQSFLRTAAQLAEQGLFVELRGYQVQVFLDWREMTEPDDLWWQLHHELDGRGVSDLEDARLDLWLRPLHEKFAALIQPGRIDALLGLAIPDPGDADTTEQAPTQLRRWIDDVEAFLEVAKEYEPGISDADEVLTRAHARVNRLQARWQGSAVRRPDQSDVDVIRMGLVWALVRSLAASRRDAAERLSTWRLSHRLAQVWADRDTAEAQLNGRLVGTLLDASTGPFDATVFSRSDVRDHLLVHEHRDRTWFHKERMDLLLDALECIQEVEMSRAADGQTPSLVPLHTAYRRSAFQYDRLLEALEDAELGWLGADERSEADLMGADSGDADSGDADSGDADGADERG